MTKYVEFSTSEVKGVVLAGLCFAIAEVTLEETEIKLRELQKFHDLLAANVKRWRKLPARRKCAAEFCDLIESSYNRL